MSTFSIAAMTLGTSAMFLSYSWLPTATFDDFAPKLISDFHVYGMSVRPRRKGVWGLRGLFPAVGI